jgi:hypothetical protein
LKNLKWWQERKFGLGKPWWEYQNLS